MSNPFNFQDAEKILAELHLILHGVPCFLIQGTALGAYRDKGFTPTERDIDIGFLQEHMTEFGKNIALRLIGQGFEIRTVNQPFSKLRAIKATKDGIKVDLNAYQKWKDKRFCSSNLQEYSIVHEASLLENTEPIELFGKGWRVPSPIETYLELEYGSDWRTPKLDHVSKTRISKYRQAEGITNDFLD